MSQSDTRKKEILIDQDSQLEFRSFSPWRLL